MKSPGPKARAFLDEVRADPAGWSWLDVRKLLSLFDFREESLDTGMTWQTVLVYHPEHPDLNVVLQPADELHSAVSLRAVTIIDTLMLRIQPGSGRE